MEYIYWILHVFHMGKIWELDGSIVWKHIVGACRKTDLSQKKTILTLYGAILLCYWGLQGVGLYITVAVTVCDTVWQGVGLFISVVVTVCDTVWQGVGLFISVAVTVCDTVWQGVGLFISVVVADRALATTVCTSFMVASLMAGKSNNAPVP